MDRILIPIKTVPTANFPSVIKMKSHTLLALICLSMLTPSLFGQTNAPADSANAVTTPPPIPEEARKHFVMGTTLFKDAKTPDDYSQVEGEFKQATDLAPQWPEARYNLALAKEAAGDYSGAMDDLKLYQQFKLSDDEARTVQDKIYALEAKQEEVTKKQAAEQKAATDAANAQAAAEAQKKQDYQDKIGFLEGRWNARVTINYAMVIPNSTPFDSSNYHADIAINNGLIVINIVNDGSQSIDYTFDGKINGSDLSSIVWTYPSGEAAEVVVSLDHQHIQIYVPVNHIPHVEEIQLSR
jgi:hypothetical protein